MSEEEKFSCPSCGALISKSDVYCKKCGAKILEVSETVSEPPISPPESLPEELYERKFSLIQRFYKLLTAPSEAMEDIALAPDYEGVLVVLGLDFVFMSAIVAVVLQKFHYSGPYAQTISGMVSGILAIAIFIALVLLAVKWVIKSLIIRYACDSGSGWDFKTAASITGYAYIADLIMGIPALCLVWFLVPTFQLDTTELEALRQALTDYQAQLSWLKLLYTLPVSLIGLLWKSYLGGLGAHHGTKKKCSRGMGVAVFFVLSLIGFLITFIT